MNTQLSQERKSQFVEQDAQASIEKLLKAVDRCGGSSLRVTAKICGCHMLKNHDWDGKEFGEEMQK